MSDYYALLPADTKAAWALLSDEMQDEVGSYGSYQGFWRTDRRRERRRHRRRLADTVTVDLTYTSANGTESETRLITVQDTGEGTADRRRRGDHVLTTADHGQTGSSSAASFSRLGAARP